MEKFARDPGGAWESSYRTSVAEPIGKLTEVAARCGVEVIEHAALSDLGASAADSAIVVVIGHWKGADVKVSDLLTPDAQAFVNCLVDSSDRRERWLREALESRTPFAVLDHVVEHGWPPAIESNPSSRVTLVASEFTRRARRRDEIDAMFSRLLRPGNRLELWDGLHSWQAVESSIGSGFSGVVDLTTCTSTYLADHIDAARKSAFRIVQFPNEIDPTLAALGIRVCLQRMRETGRRYLDVRIEVLDELARELASEANRSIGWRKFIPWRNS